MSDVICKKFFVLITDDSEQDSFFIERALRQSNRIQVIASVCNADETIAYLSGGGQYADRQLWPFPDFLLIHLKGRRPDCFDVLEWLQRSTCTDLKVVILCGSSVAAKIQNINQLGADVFHLNHPGHGKLKELVNEMEKLLLASGPNGEVAIAKFKGS